MAEIVDNDLLQKLCNEHNVPFELAKIIVIEFDAKEGTKKNYLKNVIEVEWDKYENK